MATYTEADFERIAQSIGKDPAQVTKHAAIFEAAARWYRLDCRSPRRTPPSVMQRKMDQIAKSARRLLRDLEVTNPREAADGPGEFALVEVLAWASPQSEDAVAAATQRIGKLLEVLDDFKAAREAASELERRAGEAATEVVELGKLIVPKGHQGDATENNWIATMMAAYRTIAGKEPGTSIAAPGVPDEGQPGGPLIRFLQAAGQPLGVTHSPASWRSRIRALQAPPC